MSDNVTLTYRGRSIEVDADALFCVMQDARERMGDRRDEMRRYPEDYWNHELVDAMLAARTAVDDLLFNGVTEVD